MVIDNRMQYHERMKAPVYVVKPKYIFKHPFDKYDFSGSTNRQTQNEELTDYFNYGFNEDTMACYGKFVKRMIEVLDHRHNLDYFNEPSQLMKLNDEIPMDFGGFCKFHDPSLVNTGTSENFHTGQSLMEYLVLMILSNQSRRIEYPLIELIKQMYKDDTEDQPRDNYLYEIVEEISHNNERKYEEVMKKLVQKNVELKPVAKKFQKDKLKESSEGSSFGDQSQERSESGRRNNKKRDKSENKSKRIKKSHSRHKSKEHRSKRSSSRRSKQRKNKKHYSKRDYYRDSKEGSKERKERKQRSRSRSKDRRSRDKKDKKKHNR